MLLAARAGFRAAKDLYSMRLRAVVFLRRLVPAAMRHLRLAKMLLNSV